MMHDPFHPFEQPEFLRRTRGPLGRRRSKARAISPSAEYTTRCPVCGQDYDLRELEQVLHHGAAPHGQLPSPRSPD
jgi:hypothetical protein